MSILLLDLTRLVTTTYFLIISNKKKKSFTDWTPNGEIYLSIIVWSEVYVGAYHGNNKGHQEI